jgi:hypothetical protein
MHSIHPFILAITLAIILISYMKVMFPWVFNPLEPVSVNGHKYLVLNRPDKLEAAQKLDRVRGNLLSLIDHMDMEGVQGLKGEQEEGTDRLKKKFKAVISENAPGGSYTSYTLNKGDHIYMCMRNENQMVDDNTLMFVALHELAHVMTKSIGHTPEFVKNFKFLLKLAEKRGYYKYQAYHITPQQYCGTKISSTPY